MKSNQERSNECLPPKKREILASSLPLEVKPAVVPPVSESQKGPGENLAWLASVGGGPESDGQRGTQREANGPLYKPLPAATEYPSSLPRAHTSPLPRPAGPIQYAQLPPNLHFLGSAYAGPYSGFVPSQLVSPLQRPLLEPYQQQHHGHPLPPSSSQPGSLYVQVANSHTSAGAAPPGVCSPHAHLPSHLHPQSSVLSHPQVLVQYSDGSTDKKEDARAREVLNGELEKGRRYSQSPEGVLGKQGGGVKGGCAQHQNQNQNHHHHHHQQQQQHEARHTELQHNYTQEPSGLRSSLMLVPKSHDNGDGPERTPFPEERGGLGLGKPASRASSFNLSPSLLKASVTTGSPRTVIQTTHNNNEPFSVGLPSAQPSIVGYIAGAGQRQALGYHGNLTQHLLIPGAPSIIIPVSGGLDLSPGVTTTSQQQQQPQATVQTFVAAPAPKCHPFEPSAGYHAAALVPAQLHAPSLPPYFAKGSIILLADGELKHVEDLKTEDFIQSAEISSELKIDSSTVERILGSQTSNFAIIQFAVGENHTQVSVEVLAEYPFFVFGQGWSSCSPDRTTQLFELPCAKLAVGDVCISLGLKNPRNGSLKKTRLGPGPRQHTGVTPPPSANGDLGFRDKLPSRPLPDQTQSSGKDRPVGRKRRWSAPEGRQAEKWEEEPPLTLPRPFFIPQEVKISIEGRSNIGN